MKQEAKLPAESKDEQVGKFWEKRKRHEKWDKEKAHDKKVEIYLNVPVITTTMYEINFLAEMQNFQTGLKQTFILCRRVRCRMQGHRKAKNQGFESGTSNYQVKDTFLPEKRL